MENQEKKRSPWWWVPSIYYAEGIPYVVVMLVSVIMYKRLGISNTDIALYTSWLYLPWVIKPLWSPLVDIVKTKRFWIYTMQSLIAAGLAGVAFTIPVDNFFQITLAFFWLLAFSSATHDIAADGFYLLGLSKHDQAWFIGIRSTFYRMASITGQGLLIILAGFIESNTGLPPVEFAVNAVNTPQTEVFVDPAKVQFETKQSEKSFSVYPTKLDINLERIPAKLADSLLALAKSANTSNNFYKSEEIKAEAKKTAEPTWWDNIVVLPLESLIRSAFGVEKAKSAASDFKGALGFVYLKLSEMPEEEVVINLSKSSGDNNIQLVEGARLVFNKDNWTLPAVLVFQIDPKLTEPVTANFKGLSGNIPLAWMITFFILAGLFILFTLYHKFVLPYPADDMKKPGLKFSGFFKEFLLTFVLFFKRKKIGIILAFLLLYRFAEAQLVKLASPFLLDNRDLGGLGLTTGEVGFVYGTVGILALTFGGIAGGILAAKSGLKKWLWYMVIAINIPNTVYVYMSLTQPENFLIINLMVAIEQFGYGFGFTAYMLYMIYVSEGQHKTAHFAITTGFMALGMMIPGMFSGWLQEIVGYQNFFIWVVIATIPAFIVTKFIPLESDFGKKIEEKKEE
ncbi:MAG: MFS transporter [Ignavibacteriaceae bacterium]|nr:MFS transporter [Ignavibacteriaceae bacterium]